MALVAVLLMAQSPYNQNDQNRNKDRVGGNPNFHDFLGSTSLTANPTPKTDFNGEIRFTEASASSGGGLPIVSALSDLGSERQMENYYQGVPIHGQKSDFFGPHTSNRILGRKRNNSDSILMGIATDRIPQIGIEKMPQVGRQSLESFQLMKILHDNAGGEGPRRFQEEESSFGTQTGKTNSTSHLILQPPVDSRSDSVASKWESSPMNVGPSKHYPSRIGQFAKNVNNVSLRDSNAGPSVISPPAADEGSRTGIKGSGILRAINASDRVETNAPEVLIGSSRSKFGVQSLDHEPSDPPRQSGMSSASRQMTIFYAGQAHVFDAVHPNKADVIMALAGSNGGSWSTTYSPKSTMQTLLNETCTPNRENGPGFCDPTSSQELRGKFSIPGSSFHNFNQGGRISTNAGELLNTVSGGHLGSTLLRPTRSFNQPAEPNTKRK